MHHLSNNLLIETYEKARELQLSEVFIELILEEINDRDFSEEEADWFNEIHSYYSEAKDAVYKA